MRPELGFLKAAHYGNHRFFSAFIPGVIAGGLAVQACHMMSSDSEAAPQQKKV